VVSGYAVVVSGYTVVVSGYALWANPTYARPAPDLRLIHVRPKSHPR
jgi:hypothetical protein